MEQDVRRLLLGLKTELDGQDIVLPLEIHHDPIRATGALGFEIAAIDHSRNAQPERTEVLFQSEL